MNHRTTLVLAIAMMLAAVAVMVVDFGGKPVSYDIEYNLYGGINGDNPPTYTRDDEFLFEPAFREGHDFAGWFSDPTFVNEVPGISKGTKGDLKVYAAWSEVLVGTGYVLELSGIYKSNDEKMTGTQVFSFLAKDGDEYFQELRTDVRYGASGYSDDAFYWTDDEAKLWTPSGKELLKTKDGDVLCDVLKYGDMTRWKSGSIVYQETRESDRMEYVCVLSSTFEFQAEPTHKVTGSVSEGVSAYIGLDTYAAGSDVTVRAVTSEGYRLDGWYSDNKLVSRSPEYMIHGLHDDVSLKAMAVKDATTYWTAGVETDLSDGTGNDSTVWTVTEKYSEELIVAVEGENPLYMFIDPGRYVIHNSTTGKSREAVVDGDVTRKIAWPQKYVGSGEGPSTNHSFEIEWSIPYSHYSRYKEMDAVRNHTSALVDARFITWMDEDIADLSELLERKVAEEAPEMIDDTVWMANYVLAFVQYAVEYEYDEDVHHVSEYWKYPIETLFDGKGDCEDSALLFVAITAYMDLDSSLILYLPSSGNGHAFSGIVVDAEGKSFALNGKDVYYCESTGHGYTVGMLPKNGDRYQPSSVAYPYRD